MNEVEILIDALAFMGYWVIITSIIPPIISLSFLVFGFIKWLVKV